MCVCVGVCVSVENFIEISDLQFQLGLNLTHGELNFQHESRAITNKLII